jgi:histidinol dehydrogenase
MIQIIKRAYENIHSFHSKHLRESWEETYDDGTVLGQRITPIESAGVYVPGGKAFYPSSVLMNIAPARVAGVKEIIMVSPPSFKGGIHPVVLAAARIAGATRIFRIGGAQAIAALAYGTETIPAVTKITGPGNTFVTAAKALVRGVVEIDSEAGPSEVVVLADDHANPNYVAAELLAQAEHDEEAMAVLITPSARLIEAVKKRLEEETARLPRKSIIEASLAHCGVLIQTRNMQEAIELTNLYAPEHLSVQVEYPRNFVDKIKHAGAIMLGAMTPVAVGDYYAGPNHILPTGRKARFSSPLTAEDFRKVTSVLYYSKERLQKDAADIRAFAEAEELQAHARSIEVRQ